MGNLGPIIKIGDKFFKMLEKNLTWDLSTPVFRARRIGEAGPSYSAGRDFDNSLDAGLDKL